MGLREDLRKWTEEHPIAKWATEHPVEAAFAGVAVATVLVYAYERIRWRWVRPR